MRSYLSILALAICICAVSSRSLRTFLNEDENDELQQRADRRDLNEALLLNRLRKLLEDNDEINEKRDTPSQSDESSAEDDTADAVRRDQDSDSDSVEVARKKRQLDGENDDESDQSNGDEDNASESTSQDGQASDDSNDSDGDNENQPNNQASNYLKYSDEEKEQQPNNQASEDSSEETDDE